MKYKSVKTIPGSVIQDLISESADFLFVLNMDIYGYPGYPYNQSDELAKQMFAQQALAVPYNRGIQEPHVMPAPSGAPWNAQGVTWGLAAPPHLVHFTALHPEVEQKFPQLHCKRKSLDVEPVM